MSGDEGLAAWLREAVLERKTRAEAATPGPWAWEATGDKDSSWALGLVQDEDGNSLTGQLERGQGGVIDGVCESINGHLPDAVHIAANDSRDVIARCEAELGILDEHAPVTTNGGWLEGREWQECQACGPNNDHENVFAVPGEGESFWPCATVRLLGTGYKHRPGYLEEWAP